MDSHISQLARSPAWSASAVRLGLRDLLVVAFVAANVARAQTPPVISTAPHNGDNRIAIMCVAACFEAVVSYATPAYVSMDAPRSVTLMHRSAHSKPMALVQVDATDNNGTPPDKLSIRLKRLDNSYVTFTNGSTEIFFQGATGTSRLAAQFNASSLATGAYMHTVEIRAYRSGSSVMSSAPVRVLVVNENNSPFGWGWSLVGPQRLKWESSDTALLGDLSLVEGDGSILYFTEASCTFAPLVNRCTYTSPPGDFSSLVYRAEKSAHTGEITSESFTRTYTNGAKTEFDSFGRMVRGKDRFNNTTTFAYDGEGRLSTITDPAGKVTTLSYGIDGKLDWIKDPGNRYSYVTIDAAGNLTEIVDPAGVTDLRLAYDAEHRITRRTDRRGGIWAFAYDFAGKLKADTMPTVVADGVTAPLVLALASSEARVLVDPASGLGGLGSPAPRVVPDSVRATTTNARGFATRFALDRWGAAIRIEEPLGRVSRFARNVSGQLIQTVSPAGDTTDHTWTGPNMTQVRRRSTGRTINYVYETTYNEVKEISGDTEAVSYFWSVGRLDSVQTGSGMTRIKYDAKGRDTLITDPQWHATRKFYAPSGWMNTDSIKRGSRRTALYYDAFGRDTATKDPANRISRKQLDVINRVIRTIGPADDTTTLSFDSLFLRSVTDAKGQVYQFDRNALGWVAVRTSPGTNPDIARRQDRYAHDANGNVKSWTNRRGQVVTFTYDSLDALRTKTADGATTTYHSDPLGRFVTGSNSESTDTLKFDVAGRAVAEIIVRNGTRYELQSAYNGRDLRTSLQVVSPASWVASVGYRYTPFMQLDTLIDLAGGRTAILFNGDRQPIQFTLPTSPPTTVPSGFTSIHTPWGLSFSSPEIDDAIGVTYTYGASGAVYERLNNYGVAGRDFQYDAARQLDRTREFTSTQGDCVSRGPGEGYSQCAPDQKTFGATVTFSYDKVGNRTDLAAATEAGNRLRAFDGFSLDYDDNGNLVRKFKAGVIAQTLTWNSLNQLTGVTTNGVAVTFGYDASGRRVRKTTGAGSSSFLWDGDDLFAELDGSGNRVAEYTYYPGVDQPHSVRRGGAMYFFAQDFPGNVTGMLNGAGALVNRYKYAPFGALEDSSVTVPNALRFGAREQDGETGLVYNRARYYDPFVGRFISEDPRGFPSGVNLYVYASNDPINRRDPLGLDDDCSTVKIKVTIEDQSEEFEIPLCTSGGSTIGQILDWAAGVGIGSGSAFWGGGAFATPAAIARHAWKVLPAQGPGGVFFQDEQEPYLQGCPDRRATFSRLGITLGVRNPGRWLHWQRVSVSPVGPAIPNEDAPGTVRTYGGRIETTDFISVDAYNVIGPVDCSTGGYVFHTR